MIILLSISATSILLETEEASNITTEKPITNEPEHWNWKLFVSLISLSAVCLFVTLGIYVAIREKLNCQGWTQFSYLLSLFVFDCVFIPALSPGINSGALRSTACFSLAVTNQYFFICAKTWLIIISLDLYCIIRKTKIVAANKSKNIYKFAIYSFAGWTFPFLFVSSGVILNLVNSDTLRTKIPDESLWAGIPDYGFLHCRIPNWFVWECFVFTNCVFHFVMFGLISITIFYQRRTTALIEQGSNIGHQSPLFMLLRLFIVVGLSWSYIAVQDLLRAGNINTKQNWGWHVFRCIYFLQGTFISVITLTNGRTMRNLVTKYPKLKEVVVRIEKVPKIIRNLYSNSRKESLQSFSSQHTVDSVS